MAQTMIERRQQAFVDAINSKKVDATSKWFTDDVKYSDYSWGVKDMDHASLIAFQSFIFGATDKMHFTTVSVRGTEDFTAWEWELVVQMVADDESHGLKAGETVSWKGVSLSRWRPIGDGHYQVFENHDYGSRQK